MTPVRSSVLIRQKSGARGSSGGKAGQVEVGGLDDDEPAGGPEAGQALHSDQAGFENLHAEFVGRLLPVLGRLLEASAAAGQTRADVRAYDLMLAVGNLCIGVETFPDYRARGMIDLLLAGLARGV